MPAPKIQFSPAEMEILLDAELILTKNRVMEKVRSLLEVLQESLERQRSAFPFKDILIQAPAKISKGENYLGLPYLILDYPRQFANKEIFAVRTMFWWGRFFSCTLHLDGEAKVRQAENIIQAYGRLAREGFSVGVSEDPWQHHFERDNYILIQQINQDEFKEHCLRYNHLKIAKSFPPGQPEMILPILEDSWKSLMEICAC